MIAMQEQLSDGGGEVDDTMLGWRNFGARSLKQTWWGPHELLATSIVWARGQQGTERRF